MRTELWAVAAAVLASALAAVAMLFLKWGAGETRLSLREFRLSRWVVGAIALYLLSSVFFLLALLEVQLSTVVPITALENVWVVLLARKFLRERLGAGKLAGIAGIVLGVTLVGLGS